MPESEVDVKVKIISEKELEKRRQLAFKHDVLRKYDIRYQNDKDLPEYMRTHKRMIEKMDIASIKERNKYLIEDKELYTRKNSNKSDS